MIQVIDLVKDFGGLHAVDGVSFDVEDGTITGLIGPNGAGKTTTFNMIAGSLSPTSGRVLYGDQRIDGKPTYEVFRRGLVRTFQIPRPFAEMTVLENLMMVPKDQLGEKFWNTWLRPAGVRAEERELRDRARAILAFLQLEHLAVEAAKNLSGGQLKLLELGRALMSEPTTILLDEPGAGINPTLLAQIVDRIGELNERGITFLIIEHNMDLVMNLCRPILVMANGKLLMQGDPDTVRQDARVLEAFLGGVPE